MRSRNYDIARGQRIYVIEVICEKVQFLETKKTREKTEQQQLEKNNFYNAVDLEKDFNNDYDSFDIKEEDLFLITTQYMDKFYKGGRKKVMKKFFDFILENRYFCVFVLITIMFICYSFNVFSSYNNLTNDIGDKQLTITYKILLGCWIYCLISIFIFERWDFSGMEKE